MNPPCDAMLSETEVQAFVDGLLAPELVVHMQSYLAKRPDEAHRVAFYGRHNCQMQTHFHAAGTELPRRLALRRRANFAAAVLAYLALIGATIFLTVRVSNDALERATLDALALTNGLTNARVVPPVGAPDLSAAGFHALSRQAVALGAFSRANAVTYRNNANEPLILLTARDVTAKVQLQWQARRIGSTRLLEWTSADGVRTIVGGAAPTHGLMRAADLLTRR